MSTDAMDIDTGSSAPSSNNLKIAMDQMKAKVDACHAEVTGIHEAALGIEATATQSADNDETGRRESAMLTALRIENTALQADLVKVRQAVEDQKQDKKQLKTILGNIIGQSDFRIPFDKVLSNIGREWLFDLSKVRLAVAEWRDTNEYTPEVYPISSSPDVLAFDIWVLSETRPHLLSHEVIAIWMHSAEKYFNKSSTLGFLMTALENICANELNPDQTWFAVRLLEFFVILDKDKKLQLNELLLLIRENGSKQHPVPMALCLWMQNRLDGKSSTRGQALGVWLKDPSRCIDLGLGVYTFQVEGCSDVIITDPMNKILKRDLTDVVQYINKSLDLVVSVRDYDRQAIMNLKEHTRIVAAFPDLK